MTAPFARSRLLPMLLFMGFVVTGVITTVLGPILPVFIAQWSLADARAGFFFTTQFTGSLAGVILASFLLSTRGYRTALFSGYALMAAGVAALNSHHQMLVLAATATFGSGYGLATIATNLWVAEDAGPKSASALSLMNLAWSAGSLTCPVLIMYGVRSGHLAGILFGLAAGALLIGLGILFSPVPSPADRRADKSSPAGAESTSLVGGVLLVLLFFLYVGTENGVSGWAAAFSKRLGGRGSQAWELAPMFFWTGLLTGRLLAPVILRRVSETQVALSGLAAASLGVTTLIRASGRFTAMSGVTMAGLGLAAVFPIYIAWLSHKYGVRARSIGGAFFALGSLGGAALPWLVGVVSSYSGSLRVGLLVPLGGSVIMLVIVATFRKLITQ